MAIRNTCTFRWWSITRSGFLRTFVCLVFATPRISGYTRGIVSDLHNEGRVFHTSLLFLEAPSSSWTSYACRWPFSGANYSSKETTNDDLSPNGPSWCTAYRFSALHLCVILVLPHFRVLLALALPLYDRILRPYVPSRQSALPPAKLNFQDTCTRTLAIYFSFDDTSKYLGTSSLIKPGTIVRQEFHWMSNISVIVFSQNLFYYLIVTMCTQNWR